jgi:hypothetical protein
MCLRAKVCARGLTLRAKETDAAREGGRPRARRGQTLRTPDTADDTADAEGADAARRGGGRYPQRGRTPRAEGADAAR